MYCFWQAITSLHLDSSGGKGPSVHTEAAVTVSPFSRVCNNKRIGPTHPLTASRTFRQQIGKVPWQTKNSYQTPSAAARTELRKPQPLQLVLCFVLVVAATASADRDRRRRPRFAKFHASRSRSEVPSHQFSFTNCPLCSRIYNAPCRRHNWAADLHRLAGPYYWHCRD